ncbi:hypothetical protein Pcinc_008025 [Petrolisthes cinctipes]|uniref:THAP-type domain-containing protein n=1 Tax=Petrolisthes cinctipes TaxID=88211 RepID=A0AAE1KZW8_PETCI|nr:hypothetical protein Pcinc_008025 [Petrolisthes cinctipes]
MTVFVCAVADCKSSLKKSTDKWPEMTNVKGWAKFPSVKREPKRRMLWENRCKRGAGWKATRFHRACSRHFNNWEETGPSSIHPDPELFNYDWGKKHSQRSRNVWQSNSDDIPHEIDLIKPDVDSSSKTLYQSQSSLKMWMSLELKLTYIAIWIKHHI